MIEVDKKPTSVREQLRYLVLVVGLLFGAGALWLGLRAYGPIATYQMSSSSMEPTIHQGDVLLTFAPRNLCGLSRPAVGDVIVYRRDNTSYISRVVAGGGQTVSMKAGRLIVDGRPLATRVEGRRGADAGVVETVFRETQANGASYLTLDRGPDGDLDNIGTQQIGPESWFVLGDNRDNSLDSRFVGPAPQKDICGVVKSIISSTEAAHVGTKP